MWISLLEPCLLHLALERDSDGYCRRRGRYAPNQPRPRKRNTSRRHTAHAHIARESQHEISIHVYTVREVKGDGEACAGEGEGLVNAE